MDMFNKQLVFNGIKMIYLTKKEDKVVVMIALVIFTEIKKKKIEGCYILQLKTEVSHYLELGNDRIQKFRGIGIDRSLVHMV